MTRRPSAWGATAGERAGQLPGDELVAHARYRTTHAIDIDAPAAEVWPWLVQLGQGRGGLYSYDWIENLLGLHIHSADRVEPALQSLGVGDTVRLVPEGTEPPLCFTVARLVAPSVLVLGPHGAPEDTLAAGLPVPCWSFVLSERSAHRSRLVVRFQCDYTPTRRGRLLYSVALTPVHYVMERKMMFGIKRRAESLA